MEIFEKHILPFILNNEELQSLTLDFNNCCFDPKEVLSIIHLISDAVETIGQRYNSKMNVEKQYFSLTLLFLNNMCPPYDDTLASYSKIINDHFTVVKEL